MSTDSREHPSARDSEPLSAPWTMNFTYTRTHGPIVSQFFRGLAQHKILGLQAEDGHVFCPPTGYDPRNSKQLEEWVEVGSSGTIEAVAWVDSPAEHHPFDTAFGWAQIRLDGSDSALTHFVQGNPLNLQIGDRVTAQWENKPTGTILDLAYFAPASEDEDDDEASYPIRLGNLEELATSSTTSTASPKDDEESVDDPATHSETPVSIDYDIYAGYAMSDFLRGLQNGEFIGAKAPGSNIVYVPPVGVCPVNLKSTSEPVPLKPTATLVTYIVVHIPVRDKSIPLPYACGDILLDGADTPFLGLIKDIDPNDVRRGMRLKAVLHPQSERPLDSSAISHFTPINEPDVDIERLVKERRTKVQSEYEASSSSSEQQ